jgi:hypothetical protein
LDRAAFRREIVDDSVPSKGREKGLRMDLGLELLAAAAVAGTRYTYDEIAAWCGCSESAIWLMERRALKKLRNKPAVMRQLRELLA